MLPTRRWSRRSTTHPGRMPPVIAPDARTWASRSSLRAARRSPGTSRNLAGGPACGTWGWSLLCCPELSCRVLSSGRSSCVELLRVTCSHYMLKSKNATVRTTPNFAGILKGCIIFIGANLPPRAIILGGKYATLFQHSPKSRRLMSTIDSLFFPFHL